MKDFEWHPGEAVIKTSRGDCWETPQLMTQQVPGQYIFTNQRIVFRGNGLIEKLRIKFEIPYSDIYSAKPYLVLFFPTGIRVLLKNGGCYRLSLMKRKEYMNIIDAYIDA